MSEEEINLGLTPRFYLLPRPTVTVNPLANRDSNRDSSTSPFRTCSAYSFPHNFHVLVGPIFIRKIISGIFHTETNLQLSLVTKPHDLANIPTLNFITEH